MWQCKTQRNGKKISKLAERRSCARERDLRSAFTDNVALISDFREVNLMKFSITEARGE